MFADGYASLRRQIDNGNIYESSSRNANDGNKLTKEPKIPKIQTCSIVCKIVMPPPTMNARVTSERDLHQTPSEATNKKKQMKKNQCTRQAPERTHKLAKSRKESYEALKILLLGTKYAPLQSRRASTWPDCSVGRKQGGRCLLIWPPRSILALIHGGERVTET